MGRIKSLAWQAFEKTGGVKEYLKYKVYDIPDTKLEVGEEFGAFENHRDSDKNQKIQ